MTSSLGWEPVRKQDYEVLPDKLKFILRAAFDEPVSLIFDESHIPYLHGLRDAGTDGAKELIKAVEDNGSVHVKEYW